MSKFIILAYSKKNSMKILKNALIASAIIILIGVIYLATLNGKYNVHRTIVIKAPNAVVFNNVNDYRNWKVWGPWNEMDSTLVYSFPKKTVGKGATYSWSGKSGGGNMKMLKSEPNTLIENKIHFEGQGEADGYWHFKKVNNGTEVTWGMKGKMPFLLRFMAKRMDKQVGPMFKRGLVMLDSTIQKGLRVHSATDNGITEFGGGYYLFKSTSCKFSELEKNMDAMFSSLFKYAKSNNIKIAGYPFTINYKWDEKNQVAMFSTCIPVQERIITDKNSNVLTGFMKPIKGLKITAKGNYTYLADAWKFAYTELNKKGLEQPKGSNSLEVYVTNPKEVVNPSKWVTEIYIPVK